MGKGEAGHSDTPLETYKARKDLYVMFSVSFLPGILGRGVAFVFFNRSAVCLS